MIAEARIVVGFTGAGISTESGIPDFRSPGGIWTRHKPIPFEAFLASAEARRETWRRKLATHPTIESAAPNAGHRALASLVAQGKMSAVITQNIDGLHQASGIPDDKVIELHGNTTYAMCLDCRRRYELSWVQKIFAPPFIARSARRTWFARLASGSGPHAIWLRPTRTTRDDDDEERREAMESPLIARVCGPALKSHERVGYSP